MQPIVEENDVGDPPISHAKKRPCGEVSTRRKKKASNGKDVSKVAGKPDAVKNTSASHMALGLLQHLAPGEGPTTISTSEPVTNVRDPANPPKSRPLHSATKRAPSEVSRHP